MNRMRRKLIIVIGAILGVGVLIAHLIAGGWLLGRGTGEIDETLNLLHNASFEEVDGDGAPDGWIEGKWYWDSGVSVLSLSDEAYTGEHSIMVYSSGENDARYTQTIAVEPDSWYRLRCMVKAEGCWEYRNGAGISIENTFVSSEYAYDTAGEWVELTLYGKTGPKQDYMTVMARIGGYGSLNVGRAWFDDIELVRLKSLPEGAEWVSFATNPPSSAAAEEDAEEAGDGHERNILLITAAFVLLMAAAMAVMAAGVKTRTANIVMIAGGAAAIIIRLVCAASIRGYEVDMNCFSAWASWMAGNGVNFYNMGWCDYPPGYMMVLGIVGGIRNLLGLTMDGPAVWVLLKIVPMICDVLLGLMIYHLAKQRLADWQAALLSLMYLLNPVTILNSAAWGQVDSVLTILLVLSVYSVIRGRWVRGLSIYAVAVIMKPQALMFGPIGLLALVMELVRGEDKVRVRREIGLGILSMLGILLAVITPFAAAQGRDPFTWAFELYGGTLSSYPYITINACNLYSLMGKNWLALENAGWLNYLAWGMYGLAFVYAFFLYIKSGKRGNLFIACALMLSMVFAFGAKMHERYLYPVIAFLLMAYIIHKDWRLLLSCLILSVGQFMNGALVLHNEHLQAAQAGLNGVAALMNIAGALLTAWIGWDICVRGVVIPVSVWGGGENVPEEYRKETYRKFPIKAEDWKLGIRKIDCLLMAGLTIVYSVIAFVNLGAMEAPETAWTSTLPGETVVFDLGETQTFHMTYYGGICNSSFTVSTSEDGEAWSEEQLATYNQGEIFRWLWFAPSERSSSGGFTRLTSDYPLLTARYVSITAEKAGLVLHEFGFLDEEGHALPIESVMSYGGDGDRANNPALLTDEQHTVAAYPSYYNSTYFDEIYHARTAYEHLHGMRPYETTHPPLGKVMIMWGIQLFGMTPFGWRFMGTLLGCLMIPAMYLLAKQLLKKTEYAFIAAFLLTFDCMHFTQTRIATIDTYGVFFILLMYLFMFRYCQMNFFVDGLKKTLVPLGACGVVMGLGIASKWICIYAAVGLAVLFFYTLVRRFLEYRTAVERGGVTEEEIRARQKFWKYFWLTGAFCVVFFIIIPVLIYYFSYYWYMKPMGGLSIRSVWNAQLGMFNYHSGLTDDTHFFQSPWHEWPLIEKPIWFYSGTEFMESGVVSSISCMGNPAVWWTGAAAMAYVILYVLFSMVIWVIRRFVNNPAVLHREGLMAFKGERMYLYVLIGFAAQYVPWMLVPRSMFIYHYFASVPFIILATVLAYRWMDKRGYEWRKPLMYGIMAAAVLLFIAFYPLMSGTPVLRSYANYLRWFNWYNF